MKRRGFSLLEIVATLTLLGILAAIAGTMLAGTVQRFVLEREAAARLQKLEISLARIEKELDWANWATLGVTNSGRTVTWTSRHPDRVGDGSQTLTWNGTPGSDLTLGGQALLDGIQSFATTDTVAAGYVEVVLQVTGVPQTFRVRATRPEES